MGSRKDILKNLGIPEYPWSSDDEEQSADTRPTTARPSGQQPTGSSSSAGAQRSPPTSNLLFLSRMHSNWSRPTNTATVSTNSRINLPYDMSRTFNTPPPDMLVRPAGEDRPGDDIRRVLAFRRLTRNMNSMPPSSLPRYSRNNGLAMPRSNSRPSTVVPTEANSRANSGVHRRGYRIPAISYPMPMEETPAAPRRRRRTQSMEVHNSEEEEPEEVPPPHATLCPLFPISLMRVNPDEAPPVPEPETEMETEVETQGGTSNDTSGSGVAVEDAVVEISDEPAEGPVDFIAASDQNLQPSTSQADEVDAPVSEPSQATQPGVKRKRRASSVDRSSEPLTVKEFNQKILRLLECPVCLEWMEPPMSQCRRGHLVCSRCRARLASCPVCRTTFSSVRNRAMEGVAEMLRYPCRHGCGREVRLRRRAPHEASCAARKYACPVPLCQDKLHLARDELHTHIHSKHQHLVKVGPRHRFGIKVNSEAHDNWLIVTMDEVFHMRVDVDIRTWGVIVYVSYIGPKCNAKDYAYEVSIDGQHNGRKMVYRRATHSDLESSSHNVSRQDCFHLSLDQALNFIRFKNRHCDAERILEFEVEVSKIEPAPSRDDSDS